MREKASDSELFTKNRCWKLHTFTKKLKNNIIYATLNNIATETSTAIRQKYWWYICLVHREQFKGYISRTLLRRANIIHIWNVGYDIIGSWIKLIKIIEWSNIYGLQEVRNHINIYLLLCTYGTLKKTWNASSKKAYSREQICKLIFKFYYYEKKFFFNV